MSGFWSEDCPERGPALTHAHWDKCTPAAHPGEDGGHMPFQCCHCRALDPASKMESWPPEREPDLIDVRSRLEALGLSTPRVVRPNERDTGMEDIRAPLHDDSTPVEPRAVTGNGPDGVAWGPGRGALTPRQYERLLRVMEQQDWLDAQRKTEDPEC